MLLVLEEPTAERDKTRGREGELEDVSRDTMVEVRHWTGQPLLLFIISENRTCVEVTEQEAPDREQTSVPGKSVFFFSAQPAGFTNILV